MTSIQTYEQDSAGQWWCKVLYPSGVKARYKAVQFVCERCYKTVVRRLPRSKGKTNRVCSLKCIAIQRPTLPFLEVVGRYHKDAEQRWWFQHVNKAKPDVVEWRPASEINCAECHKPFPKIDSKLRFRGAEARFFCSVSCRRVAVQRESPIGKFGAESTRWKGGITTSGGYVLIKVSNHPSAQRGQYVMEHRLVMEKKLGRYLLPTEIVHHKNGITDDNRIENLELFTTHHPHGARVDDLTAWAISHLRLYSPEVLFSLE